MNLAARTIHSYSYSANEILDIVFALNDVKAKLTERNFSGLVYQIRRKNLIFHISSNELQIYHNFKPVSFDRSKGVDDFIKTIYKLTN
jgi:hypothetical protein